MVSGHSSPGDLSVHLFDAQVAIDTFSGIFLNSNLFDLILAAKVLLSRVLYPLAILSPLDRHGWPRHHFDPQAQLQILLLQLTELIWSTLAFVGTDGPQEVLILLLVETVDAGCPIIVGLLYSHEVADFLEADSLLLRRFPM